MALKQKKERKQDFYMLDFRAILPQCKHLMFFMRKVGDDWLMVEKCTRSQLKINCVENNHQVVHLVPRILLLLDPSFFPLGHFKPVKSGSFY